QWPVISDQWVRGEQMTVRSYQDLVVWQRAMDLVVAVYRISSAFPGEERFGLTSQMRRAAVAVPSNIAEGQGRHTTGEFLQFLGHARGSLMEVETQLMIAGRLEFILPEQSKDLSDLTSEVGRLLNALCRSLRDR